MKSLWALILLLFMFQFGWGQDKKIDQLEILYDQAYYSKVLRKANRMLDKPEFDYSGLPSYYKALALLRLAEDQKWYRHHKGCIQEAISAYDSFAAHNLYDDYIHAHYYEIAALKTYLEKLETRQKELGHNQDAKAISDFSFNYFKSIKGKPDTHTSEQAGNVGQNENSDISLRDQMVVYARSLIGIKYVWAGSDESGFDCSGFTSYVCKKYGLAIPRTASGQMDEAKKVKLNDARKGDLVFFGSGAKITHVGIVVSDKGESLTMIHASTSKGVIVTNVENSSYWKPKLKGAGSYLD